MARLIAVVTGAGSGIGRATALKLIERGYAVYDFSRRDRSPEGVSHIACDISDESAVSSAVARVIESEGRIDLLVNNAGFGISGAIEFTEKADIERILSVNLLGCDNLCRHVIPHMRANGGGRVINISSVAAALPIPYQAWYSAGKAAINAYTFALINELRQFNISACAVMPGDIKTEFTSNRKKRHSGDDVYNGRIESAVSKMERDETRGMPAEKVGALVAKLAVKRRVKPAYAVGLQYKLIYALSKLLPASFTNFVVGKMYS